MENNLKKIRTIAILLIAILVSIVAFCGVYFKTSGIWKDKIPDFNYGMELSGMRELRFKLDDSEEEKEVYIDSEGNVAGEVIDQNSDNPGEISLTQDGTENAEESTAEEISVPGARMTSGVQTTPGVICCFGRASVQTTPGVICRFWACKRANHP